MNEGMLVNTFTFTHRNHKGVRHSCGFAIVPVLSAMYASKDCCTQGTCTQSIHCIHCGCTLYVHVQGM